MQIPTHEPAQLVAGDTAKWTRSLSDYPADEGWTLTYTLVRDGVQEQFSASADGDKHAVTVAAATTAAWTVGEYHWQARVEKSGEKYVIGEGVVEVLPDFAAASSGYDARTHEEKVLEALKAVQEGRASKSQKDMSISSGGGGVSIGYLTPAELGKEIRRYEALVARQREGQAGKTGSRSRVLVRFRE